MYCEWRKDLGLRIMHIAGKLVSYRRYKSTCWGSLIPFLMWTLFFLVPLFLICKMGIRNKQGRIIWWDVGQGLGAIMHDCLGKTVVLHISWALVYKRLNINFMNSSIMKNNLTGTFHSLLFCFSFTYPSSWQKLCIRWNWLVH